MTRAARLALLAGALAGCGDAGADAPAFVLRDSAGITIAESAAPAWGDGEGWRLSDQPLVEIGTMEGPEEYQLFRVSGALRLDDGRIAVANAGTHEIRFYDPEGRFLSAAGREGEGPGEFRAIRDLRRYRGDSLAVLDRRLQRLTLLGPDGTHVREATLHPAPVNPRLLGALEDGSFLVTTLMISVAGEQPQDLTVDVIRYDPLGALTDSVAEHFYYRAHPVRVDGQGLYIMNPHLAPLTQLEITPTGYAVGEGKAYEVVRYGPGGALERLDRWSGPDRTLTSEHKARFREALLERAEAPADRRVAELQLERVPFAEARAAYVLMLAARDGALWLRTQSLPGEDGPALWDLLSAEGRWLGQVQLPRDLQPLDIGSDWLLGLWRDDLGIERVQLYALETAE